jgi:hypothetical protein
MGQAAVDLPDPLDVPPAASLSGTDDLLAQLAGDEIDRLLAEASADEAPSPPDDASPAAAAIAPAPSPPSSASPTVGNDVVPPAAPAEPSAIASAPAPEALPAAAQGEVEVDDDIGALLNDLTLPKPAPAVAPDVSAGVVPEAASTDAPAAQAAGTPAEPASAAPADATVPAESSEDGPPPETVMSAAERDALSLADLADEVDAAAEQDAADAADEKAARRIDPLIRVLEVLNAPLASLPDSVRDTLGKVAILTLVNSLAVLIYVLFIR